MIHLGKLTDILTLGVVGAVGYLAYKFITDPLGLGGIGKGISDFFASLLGGAAPYVPPPEKSAVEQFAEATGGAVIVRPSVTQKLALTPEEGAAIAEVLTSSTSRDLFNIPDVVKSLYTLSMPLETQLELFKATVPYTPSATPTIVETTPYVSPLIARQLVLSEERMRGY